MSMFNQDETITDEFFTSESEQVDNESAESNDEEVSEENNESESNDNVENEDESSTKEQEESELIAGKFKSQDDLVNAYKNLEKEFTKSRQSKQQQPDPTQQTNTQPVQQNQGDPADLFWTHMQSDPFGTLNYLIDNAVAAKTAHINEKEQDNTLGKDMDILVKEYKQIQSEEGMISLFNKSLEIATSLGNENLYRNPKVLKMAAQEIFGGVKADLYKQAKEEGKKEADETRRMKQELSTVVSSKKPAEKARTTEDDIMDAILQHSKSKGLFG